MLILENETDLCKACNAVRTGEERRDESSLLAGECAAPCYTRQYLNTGFVIPLAISLILFPYLKVL